MSKFYDFKVLFLFAQDRLVVSSLPKSSLDCTFPEKMSIGKHNVLVFVHKIILRDQYIKCFKQ